MGQGHRPRRWWRLALATLFGRRARGVFVPYRHADGLLRRGYPAIEAAFEAARPGFQHWLDRAAAYAPDFERIAGHSATLQKIAAAVPPGPPAPAAPARWGQDWFPGLDAAMAYAMVRAHRPARILEIGSGHSTRFLARAVVDGGLATRITAIDPAPRADIAGLASVELRRQRIETVAPGALPRLAAGDILFVDSSHLVLAGGDVDLIFGELLAHLPPGGLLHVHDIFLPDPYPEDWAWRGYAEQTVVAALLAGGGWRVLFSSHFARSRMTLPPALAALPLKPGAREASLWLERV